MKKAVLVLLGLVGLIWAQLGMAAIPVAAEPKIAFIVDGKTMDVTVTDLKKANLKEVEITLLNPIYTHVSKGGTQTCEGEGAKKCKQKSYRAFKLVDVLKYAKYDLSKPLNTKCVDGYVPTLSALAGKSLDTAYLAFGEKGGVWEDVQRKGSMATPAPFWIVWTDPSINRALWPYQLRVIGDDPTAVLNFKI